MGRRDKFDRTIKDDHIIEHTEAFKEFLKRSTLKDPNSVKKGLVRFLREMAQCELNEVQPLHIEHTIQRLSTYGYKPQYVKRLAATAVAFFKWCHDLGFVTSNPSRGVAIPDATGNVMPVEVEAEVTTSLKDHVLKHGTPDDVILLAALLSGARLSEPCWAVIKDIELNTEARVPFLWLGTKTTRRRAQLPPWCFDSLVAVIQASQGVENRFVLNFPGTPEVQNQEWLTTNVKERTTILTMRTDRARGRLTQLQEGALGKKVLTPKDLRSTFITRNIRRDNTKVVDIALQVGNSIDVIRTKYLNNVRVQNFEMD